MLLLTSSVAKQRVACQRTKRIVNARGIFEMGMQGGTVSGPCTCLTKSRLWEIFPNMGNDVLNASEIDRLIGQRLKALRAERAWSLDELAAESGVSRATLSRLENAEVSPTTAVLGKLCAAYGMTLSRLMRMVEDTFPPMVPRQEQPVWRDEESGFLRRSISPPSSALAGEALECTLEAGCSLAYDRPPRPGLEHHLWLLEGKLEVTVQGRSHHMRPGDSLRYQLFGTSVFTTPPGCGAHYVLFMV